MFTVLDFRFRKNIWAFLYNLYRFILIILDDLVTVTRSWFLIDSRKIRSALYSVTSNKHIVHRIWVFPLGRAFRYIYILFLRSFAVLTVFVFFLIKKLFLTISTMYNNICFVCTEYTTYTRVGADNYGEQRYSRSGFDWSCTDGAMMWQIKKNWNELGWKKDCLNFFSRLNYQKINISDYSCANLTSK